VTTMPGTLREFLEDFFSEAHESQGSKGLEYVFTCPFCGRQKRLWINSISLRWVCYGCRPEGGRLASLLQESHDLGPSEAEDLVLEARAELDRAPNADDLDLILQTLRGLDLHEPAARFPWPPPGFVPIWDPTNRSWNVPPYLRARRIRLRTAMAFGLGFCPRGYYRNRLILPFRNFGQIVYFQGRDMRGTSKIPYLGPSVLDEDGKRISGIPKAGALFGLDEAIGASPAVVVVEGPIDVLTLHQHGIPAVALAGKSCSAEQADTLSRSGFDKITVMLDGDAQDQTKKVAAFLATGISGVHRALLPARHDPDSAPKQLVSARLSGAKRLS